MMAYHLRPSHEVQPTTTNEQLQIYRCLEKNPQQYSDDATVQYARRHASIDCDPLLSLALAAIRGLRRHPDHWPAVVPRILEDLCHLKEVWTALIEADVTKLRIEPMLQLFEAQNIKNDCYFMNLAIQGDASCMKHLGSELWPNSEFVFQLLQSKPILLTLLPGEAFEDRPEWLQEALVLLLKEPLFTVGKASDFFVKLKSHIPLPGEFIVDDWIPGGGPLSRQVISVLFPDLKVPKHIWETFVVHCTREDYLVESFSNAATYLRADVNWMSRMIHHRPVLYETATAEVQVLLQTELEAFTAPFRFLMGQKLLDEEELYTNIFEELNDTTAGFLGSERLRRTLGNG